MAHLLIYNGELYKAVDEQHEHSCKGCAFSYAVGECRRFHVLHPDVRCVSTQSIYVLFKEKENAPS